MSVVKKVATVSGLFICLLAVGFAMSHLRPHRVPVVHAAVS
jgi:hypothetical protein